MGMLDQLKDFNKMRKIKAEMSKELEKIFAVVEKGGVRVVVRGDKHIEKIEFDGDEDKTIKDALNNAMKEVDKKVEKQMRGKLGDLGLPGF
jgi:DNA-binding protein YbaB